MPQLTQELDVVAKGIVTEMEARELFALYFTGCHRVLAMFDERFDTYESIRERSRFCFCSLLMVAAKVRDGGGNPSPTQKALEREACQIAKDTLFGPIKSIEVAQGMLLIAAWGHAEGGTGWVVAGHAVRIAVELGIDKALLQLAHNQRLGITEEDNDRKLVQASRTWCALFVFEYQLAFGMRRPAMMGDNSKANIAIARHVLLRHPLSIPTDLRLVSTCELLCIQFRVHDALGSDEEDFDEGRTLEVLQDARIAVDAWRNEWDTIMGLSHASDGFFRSSAGIQRAYAHLFHNSLAIRNIRTRVQAKSISPRIKAVAFEAVDAAKEALSIVLHNEEYREGLRFAVSYTHICAAFAGGFLLRMARLFPGDVDAGETYQIVEDVAKVLSQVPAKRYSEALKSMLVGLRQRKGANMAQPAASTIKGNHSATHHLEYANDFSQLLHPQDVMNDSHVGQPQALAAFRDPSFDALLFPDALYPSWITDLQFDPGLFSQPEFTQTPFSGF